MHNKSKKKPASPWRNKQETLKTVKKSTPVTVATIALLVFVAGSLFYVFAREFQSGQGLAGSRPTGEQVADNRIPGGKAAAEGQRKVVAYYFRATARCASCMTIEEYTRDAIFNGFPDALKNGLLLWQVVNVEEPGNEHFVRDYRLYSQSVVLVELQDGKQTKWKNLEQVWLLLGDKSAFSRYVQEEVRLFLAESR
ncbi:MAG: hypothetical protein C4570_06290 [Ammonifex sp.]|nr:MAG: hypothetical protein C4570_06290 [Ammonifex sp.]